MNTIVIMLLSLMAISCNSQEVKFDIGDCISSITNNNTVYIEKIISINTDEQFCISSKHLGETQARF